MRECGRRTRNSRPLACPHRACCSPLNASKTETLKVLGAAGFSQTLFIALAQSYNLPSDIAKHLADNYGDQGISAAVSTDALVAAGCGGLTSTMSFAAHKIGAAAKAAAEGSASQHAGGAGTRLHPSFPFTEEEVRFAVKEYTCTVADMLFRRLRLAFLDLNVARSVAPRVRTAQHNTPAGVWAADPGCTSRLRLRTSWPRN